MKAKVVLLARVSDGGQYPFLPVPQARNGKFIPVEKTFAYYLRYSDAGKRRCVNVGRTLDVAVVALRRQELALQAARTGVALPQSFRDGASRRSIADAAEDFLADLVTLDKARATRLAYGNAIRDFQVSCTKTFLDEIERRDILAHIDWLRASLQKRAVGEQATTIRGRLRYLTVFLNKVGVGNPLPTKEWPAATKKNPDRYSIETINQLLAVADRDETDLILFFLYTGFRDEEAAFCKYSDFNWRSGAINVHDKPEYGWTAKDREPRPIDIPLPPDFVKRMEARRARNKGSDLVFPNSRGGPNSHLIRILRRVAERAGVEGRVTLHKFRRTFGTLYAKKFGLQTAKQLLGHDDIKTTALYLAAEEMDTRAAKAAVTEMFSPVGRRRGR